MLIVSHKSNPIIYNNYVEIKYTKDLNNVFYYMAESIFAMRLANLRSVTCYTDQNF